MAPASFYAADRGEQGVRPHYDGLPVDFTAQAITALGARAVEGFRTCHVLNPHDDGISLDEFVAWMIDAGHPIERLGNYDDWVGRFETALRALPEKRRQHSVLALMDAFRRPAPRVAGSSVPAEGFRAQLRALALGPGGDIPHLSASFIHKVLADLQRLDLI